jgi:hypothetical protein
MCWPEAAFAKVIRELSSVTLPEKQQVGKA